MNTKSSKFGARLLSGAAILSLVAFSSGAHAETAQFSIPPQSLEGALRDFGTQSGHALLVDIALVDSKTSRGLSASADPETALKKLLAGTGLSYKRDGEVFAIFADVAAAARPVKIVSIAPTESVSGSAVEGLVVTAQKRRENIQDVPIAISAFSQDKLEISQIAGGPDLMTQVPNMTFTKTNFSGYSIQIRGIGTQAVSATTDAAVAVAFNNTSFIRNRFFEQEFYDLERVEVLRGPQGTLYGRNATAGAVNIISAKPVFDYESKASVDVGNYSSGRLEAMANIPLVEDKAALRFAGAWTKRDGYVENQITGDNIDGRDLWSTRLSLRLAPTDSIDVNIIWEHFEENDDRLRSGKQVCKTHDVLGIDGYNVGRFDSLPNYGQGGMFTNVAFSQGCEANSLYDKDSFQTPNGLSLPYYYPLSFIFLPTALTDPYVSRTQSTDLRVIESTAKPEYKAQSDVLEIQANFDITDHLSLTSETAYAADSVFALQDFNRFNTQSGAWSQESYDNFGPVQHRDGVMENGVFCDPQIGCSDRLVAMDLSTANSRHFSQEFRLTSDFDGLFNFSAGVNFLRYNTEDKYYVFINSLSLISAISPYGHIDPLLPYVAGETDNSECMPNGVEQGTPGNVYPVVNCTFMDTNPIGQLNDLGHNYFLSKNPYKLVSYAAFGEGYWHITDTLKLTAGLRITTDKKEAPRIPSWLLASNSAGYPVAEVVKQEWTKPTGRLAIDWKPDLVFTGDTLLYASYAHGYKAGGANPPNYTYIFYAYDDVTQSGSDQSATRPKTFAPEYIDAFELGAKNTFLDGALTLNLASFYYDYEGYQISEIVDRSAFNRNFDATVWGLELEADWQALENLRFGLKVGYEKTRIADGERAIDLMDRTAGNDDWIVVRPFPTFASNCILPKWLFLGEYDRYDGLGVRPGPIALGGVTGGNPGACEIAYIKGYDPVTDAPYVPNPTGNTSMQSYHPNYIGWNPNDESQGHNHGEGFFKDLGGNELPNAPNLTATLTADYTLPLGASWLATLHTDLYYQSEAWTRVFNTDGYDKLKAYTNVNLAAIFVNEDLGLNVMAYVKNVFDRDSITGAFLNSDDTGLTTNVFLTEPRHYGVRVSKNWSGIPFWKQAGDPLPKHEPGTPYLFTLELGGQVQRQDASNEAVIPSFADQFPASVDVFGDTQNEDLDWGDGRDFKLTMQPGAGPWKASLTARYGRTNGMWKARAEELTDPVCGWGGDKYEWCDPDSEYYFPIAMQQAMNWSDSTMRRSEEHQFVDFIVSRDVGLGGLSSSAVGLGVRYAQFQSEATLEMNGVPDRYLTEGWINGKYVMTRHGYEAEADVRREFEGEGPILRWDVAKTLIGDKTTHLDMDWAIAAGVLFGRQKTVISGFEDANTYEDSGKYPGWATLPIDTVTTPINIRRTSTVTAPTLGGSLGLSFTIDRVSVGAGYRWEKYFDVIDGGYTTPKDVDRTVDGPYFKVALGFGG